MQINNIKSIYDYSFIVTSRNDNHGGNMIKKNQFFIDRWLYSVKKFNLKCELIIVDWNSKTELRKVLKIPKLNNNQNIRIITVPNFIHKKFSNSKKIKLHQMIAKNVGAVRALGEYLVLSNIDIIFSEKLLAKLKERKDKKTIYRVDRYDVDINLNEMKNYKINEKTFKQKITTIFKKYYIHDVKVGKKYYTQRTFLGMCKYFAKIIINKKFLLNIKKNINVFNRNIKYILFLLTTKKLHLNACGDFTMLSKYLFLKLNGYYEFEGYPLHIDSILLYKSHFNNYKIKNLKEKIYHINHSSGYTGYCDPDRFFLNLRKKKIPYIDTNKLIKIIYSLKKNQKFLNNTRYGLSNTKLKEFNSILSR